MKKKEKRRYLRWIIAGCSRCGFSCDTDTYRHYRGRFLRFDKRFDVFILANDICRYPVARSKKFSTEPGKKKTDENHIYNSTYSSRGSKKKIMLNKYSLLGNFLIRLCGCKVMQQFRGRLGYTHTHSRQQRRSITKPRSMEKTFVYCS